MTKNKSFIIDNYKDNQRLVSKKYLKNFYQLQKTENSEIVFIKLKSSSFSCGDEIEFLVQKKNNKITKVMFSNENCCIITGAAANIACSYLENNISCVEIGSLINNIRKMIQGKEYSKEEARNFEVFSGIEAYNRSECLEIIVKFIEQATNYEKF